MRCIRDEYGGRAGDVGFVGDELVDESVGCC